MFWDIAKKKKKGSANKVNVPPGGATLFCSRVPGEHRLLRWLHVQLAARARRARPSWRLRSEEWLGSDSVSIERTERIHFNCMWLFWRNESPPEKKNKQTNPKPREEKWEESVFLTTWRTEYGREMAPKQPQASALGRNATEWVEGGSEGGVTHRRLDIHKKICLVVVIIIITTIIKNQIV